MAQETYAQTSRIALWGDEEAVKIDRVPPGAIRADGMVAFRFLFRSGLLTAEEAATIGEALVRFAEGLGYNRETGEVENQEASA